MKYESLIPALYSIPVLLDVQNQKRFLAHVYVFVMSGAKTVGAYYHNELLMKEILQAIQSITDEVHIFQ